MPLHVAMGCQPVARRQSGGGIVAVALDKRKRRQNERKFGNWEELPDGGRRYWYEVLGRMAWKARYVKVVGGDEATVRFYQEIYDDNGTLVEIHEKYPVDEGHQPV